MGFAIHATDVAATGQPPVSRGYAWRVFALTFGLMIFDYVDRQVVVSMFPHLKAQWSLSDAQLGALVAIVSIVVAIGTVPLSLLADRWSRVKSMFVMALVWSLATIACAFAQSYGQLLFMRGVVGLGEAAYGAAGAALLATVFPGRLRSTVLGAFLAAGLIGSVIGVVLGGVIAQRWGWQAGFGAVGVPGLLLAVAFLLVVRDYKTVDLPSKASAAGAPTAGRSLRVIFAEVFRPRTVLITCLGAGLQLVMVSTTYAWLPSYFNRYYGLAPDKAGLQAGVVVLASALGAIAWSMLADRLAKRRPRARLLVPFVAALATTILMVTAFGVMSPGPAQFAVIVAGGLTMTASIGPVAAVIVDVVHPGVRATAAAVLSLTQNLFGLAAGPVLAGLLSDHYGLSFALTAVPLFCMAAAVMFAIAAGCYEPDLGRATRDHSPSDAGARPQAA